MTAADLGKRLLREVEEVGLDEILNTLCLQNDSQQSYFSFPYLDDLLQCVQDARTSSTATKESTPVIELMSLQPCGGKTHLLYHLIGVAVLPTSLGGRQSTVMMLDTDGHFDVNGLAQQIKRIIVTQTEEDDIHDDTPDDILLDCLKHVHIFHPQSLPSTIATLKSLPRYLFDARKHHSLDRPVGFIALDSASVFYWQARCDAEDAAFEANLSNTTQPNSPTQYAQLAAAVQNATRILTTPAIFTSRDLNPAKASADFGPHAHSIRPSLPPPWQTLSTLRLVVRRVEVRKLPVEATVEDALRETEFRQQVVERGKFECFVNEWGLDERTVQKIQDHGAVFDFRITQDGLDVSKGTG